MLPRNSVCLWLLVSLIIAVECTWSPTEAGKTYRLSLDVHNSYIYFEKLGDLSMYYGVHVPDVMDLNYGFKFLQPGEIDFSVDPNMLGFTSASDPGLTVSSTKVISTQSPGTPVIGYKVGNANIPSFFATLTPADPSFRICVGFMDNIGWYTLCTTDPILFDPQSYGTCGSCDCACATCFGPKETQCISCSPGYYQELSTTSTTCIPCGLGCATCPNPGPSPNTCFTCLPGFYLDGAFCMNCAFSCKVCSGPLSTQCSECLDGYYLNTIVGCAACALECATCSGDSNSCLSCSSGYYLFETTCTPSCPSGYYQNNADNTCSPCAEGCAICTGGSNTQCDSCSLGYYLQPSPSTTCLPTCPNGYFGMISVNACTPCPSGCATCTGGGQCQSCISGYYLSGSMCKSCAPVCTACTGFNQCSACALGLYLQPPNSSASCLPSCPQGYYADASANTCTSCAVGCATCTGGDSTQCQTCTPGYFLFELSTCKPCAVECATCTGGSNNECETCSPGYSFQPNSSTCRMCTPGCLSCTSSTTCNLCETGYYMLPDQTGCVTTCPLDLCTNSSNQSCFDCKLSCGDGQRLDYEACDDRNTIDGDGCSSKCTVEEYWSCQGGSSSEKDTCTCSDENGVSQFGASCIKLDAATQQIVTTTSSIAFAASGGTEDGLLGAQLISGASGSMFATALNSLHLLMLFKYCDVGYPPNVEEFFKLLSKKSSSSGSSAPTNGLNVFNTLGEKYALENATHNRFRKFGAKTFFLSNMGSFLFVIVTLLFVIALLNILKKLLKNTKAPRRVISRTLLPNFQWNMLLNSIIGAHTKLALAWFLQFSHPFGNTYSLVNFIIALMSTLAILGVYIAIIFKVSWNWGIVKEQLFLSRQVLAKALMKQNQLAILWKAYDVKSSIGRYFVILQMVRNTIQVAIIFTLSTYPLAQCYSLLFLSALYMVIIGVGRPFNRAIDTLNAISNEACLLLEEILMTIFAVNKDKNFMTLSAGYALGWVMIGIIFLSLGMNGLCIAAAIITSMVESIKKKKQKQAKILRMRNSKKGAASDRSGQRMSARRRVTTSNTKMEPSITTSIKSTENEMVDSRIHLKRKRMQTIMSEIN